MRARVAVVGAGISGASCAATLRESGVEVTLVERGRAPGGRLAAPELHGRRVDLGAAYFTVSDDQFGETVEDWRRRGVARPWTDAFDAFDGADHTVTSGPLRWSAPNGLRSLARDVLDHSGVDVRLEHAVTSVDELDHDAVVLAMPDPQAARLVEDAVDWVDYEPVIAVAAGWDRRSWPVRDAAFVNGDPDLSFVADDGARRGDDAPVLVAHTSAERARRHLDAPDDAIAPVLAALRRVLDVDAAPEWTSAHRWTFAKPAATHGQEPFAILGDGGRPVGLCGDSWCPQGSPRVEAAWVSGRRLGLELARALA